MKKFLIKTSLFLLTFVVVMGSLAYAVFVVERVSYERVLKMPTDKSMLVVGDSQTVCMDTRCMDGLFNYSLQALRPLQRWAMVNDLLRVNPNQIKTLIIDVSPYQYYTQGNHVEGRACYYSLLYFWHYDDPDCRAEVLNLERTFYFFKTSIFRKIPRLFKLKYLTEGKYRSYMVHPTPGGGSPKSSFDPSDAAAYELSMRYLAERIEKYNQSGEMNEKMFRNTIKLIDDAQARGIRVVLTTTPINYREREAHNPKKDVAFFERVTRLAHEKGVQYINAFAWDFPDEQWGDANHLNAKGAKVFATKLNTVIHQFDED